MGKASPPPAGGAELLQPIRRTETRAGLRWPGTEPPFCGEDLWRAWELRCCDQNGRPQQFLGKFRIPADSPCLPESKSLKLYLYSLSEQRIGGARELCARLRADLGRALETEVEAECFAAQAPGADWAPRELPGRCLDEAPADERESADEGKSAGRETPAGADASLLQKAEGRWEREMLHTHLFCSLCPMTAQPDWAGILIRYSGPALQPDRLLAYLLSYRRHQGFHEECVERIFCDLLQCAAPEELAVGGFFLRRGGIDINPQRRLPGESPLPTPRLLRQ